MVEQALHTTALFRIQLSSSTCSQQSAATKNYKFIGSRPSTAEATTRPSTELNSLAASFGSSDNYSIHVLNTGESTGPLVEKLRTNPSIDIDSSNDQNDEDFGDTRDVVIGSGHEGWEEDGAFITAVQQWPRVHSQQLKYQILERGMSILYVYEFILTHRYYD